MRRKYKICTCSTEAGSMLPFEIIERSFPPLLSRRALQAAAKSVTHPPTRNLSSFVTLPVSLRRDNKPSNDDMANEGDASSSFLDKIPADIRCPSRCHEDSGSSSMHLLKNFLTTVFLWLRAKAKVHTDPHQRRRFRYRRCQHGFAEARA